MKVFDLKPGDLVEVSFGETSPALPGLFVAWDEDGQPDEETLCCARALVLWDGDVYSTPVDQIEVIHAA